MLPTEPKVGWVFRYSYLWHWQFVEGREEGDKDRPALVLALVAHLDDGTPAVRVLPITHTPPSNLGPNEIRTLAAWQDVPTHSLQPSSDLQQLSGH